MRHSCLHTHSVFCDGKDEIETLCAKAFEKGLVAIGFSSHAPVYRKAGLKTGWHIREDRLHEYLDTVCAARRRWEGKLAVYLGLEVDYIEGRMGPADRDYRDMGLDYIIGSVHYVFPPKGGEPMAVDSSPEEFAGDIQRRFSGDGEALMEAYWNTVEGMIRAGGFDILGHLDLIKKNNPQGEWFSPDGEAYRCRIAGIVPPIAQSGVTVEVNTGGLNQGKTQDTYPSLPLLRLLRERDVPALVTADAHRAEHLDGHYDTARNTLLAAGYTQAMLFMGRHGENPVWIADPL
jgi:histidinol-phosphatase (PHP family)